MLSKQLDPTDIKQTKADYTQQLEKLEAKLADLPDEHDNIELLLKNAVTALSRLTTDYKQATPERKRQIISSIYPEKLSFDGSAVRTTRVNDVAASIYLINKKLVKCGLANAMLAADIRYFLTLFLLFENANYLDLRELCLLHGSLIRRLNSVFNR